MGPPGAAAKAGLMVRRSTWLMMRASRKLLMSDGARKARLNEKRTDCSGVGLTMNAVRGEKFGSSRTLNLSRRAPITQRR